MQTNIVGVEESWNPVTDCNKSSFGNQNNQADQMPYRLQAKGKQDNSKRFQVTCHSAELKRPFSWKNPRLVFVNSTVDLFHDDVPLNFIYGAFLVMSHTRQHTYQILTKHSERLLELNSELRWESNIWMGVCVEDQEHLYRIEHLRRTGATNKLVSFKPTFESVTDIDLTGIDWVISGGESGPRFRPVDRKWVRR